MNWFERMMRNVGLMVHNTTKPLRKEKKDKKTIVNKTVEEKQVDDKTIIRRTTIEEIEIRSGDDK